MPVAFLTADGRDALADAALGGNERGRLGRQADAAIAAGTGNRLSGPGNLVAQLLLTLWAAGTQHRCLFTAVPPIDIALHPKSAARAQSQYCERIDPSHLGHLFFSNLCLLCFP